MRKLGSTTMGFLMVSAAVAVSIPILVVVSPLAPPPAERPARSPLTGALTRKTIVYFGDSREPECRRVRAEVFQWDRRFPLVTKANLIVRYRKDDERANIHVVEHSEFPHLAEQRRVPRFPCWIFLNDGKEVTRHYGFLDAEALREFWREQPTRPQVAVVFRNGVELRE